LLTSWVAFPAQLDELSQRVAVERWPELLVDELGELFPGRCAAISLQKNIPLGGLPCHAEGGQENLSRRRRLLNAEELITTVEPGKRVFEAIIGGE
jgi:hypothetical protein